MFKRISILIILLSVMVGVADAQYDAAFSHYWVLQPYYNPASVGCVQKLNIRGVYSMAMAGYTHNPNTMYINADTPFYFLNSFHGAGIGFYNDQIGVFTHQNINLKYSGSFKLAGGRFRIGAQIGLLTEKYDGGKIELEDGSDKVFPKTTLNGNSLDVGAGLYYNQQDWYVGAAAMHLTAPTVKLGETNQIKVDRSYNFLCGCNIYLRNPFIVVKPSAILRTDFVAYKADITGRVEYTYDGKKLEGGLSYSPGTSFTVLVGGDFHGVNLGYSYEVFTSGVSISNGTHELVVGYEMDMNFTKRGRNKHKSVRLL